MTDAQLTANRANSQLSTGPRTEAGKRRSSLNSFRHGLTGQIFVATPEETEVFQRHCASILQALQPVGPIESYLAQSIAEGMWRLQRARALENGIFANGHRDHVDQMNAGHPEVDTALAQSRTWTEQAHNLHLLTVYEQRINRAVEKNTAQLNALQSARQASHQQAEEQAILFVQLAESKGETYVPAADFIPASDWGGFVFASAKIAAIRQRASRLQEALDHSQDTHRRAA
jgi:hypothetical protein